MSKRSADGRDTQDFAVSQDCEAWCGRCKQTTYHTVVAMKGDKPKQVACRSCNDWHGYSPPRDEFAPVSTPPPRRRKAGSAEPQKTMRRRKAAPRQAEGEDAGPDAGATVAEGASRYAPSKSAGSAEARWRAALDEASVEPQDYDYRASYVAGDVIRHQSHGLCVVIRAESRRRAIVLCRDGERAILTPGARK